MRPYLAILQDSFRFALSSRVLLVMLVIISVVLIAVAPASYREQLTTEIYHDEIPKPTELALRIASGADLGQNEPRRRVWDRLSPEFRNQINAYIATLQENDQPRENNKRSQAVSSRGLADELNKILVDREFYATDAWRRERLSPEARALLDAGVSRLSDEQVMRLNRLLLESSFYNFINAGPPTSIRIIYWPIETDWVHRLRIEEIRQFITARLPWAIDTFLLSVGLLIAAIVTAPLIPQTFEPGSLSLQLSKPISRSLLFLSKFVGGCAFTLLCATYFFIGLWLILGFRWQIWVHEILWCIPIYVFVFSIYYTVSAIAGLIWRNAVVSIVVVIAFWFFCFVIGTAKNWWQEILDFQRFKQLIVFDDQLIAVNEINVPQRWNKSTRQWQETLLTASEERTVSVLGMTPQSDMIGPVADRNGKWVALVKNSWSNRRTWNDEATLSIAYVDDELELRTVGKAPYGTFAIAPETGGTIVAVSGDGLFHRIAVPAADQLSRNGDADDAGGESKFQVCGPVEKFAMIRPYAAAMNRNRDVLAVYSRGTIRLFKANENGQFAQVAVNKLEGVEIALTSLAFAGDALMIAHSDGKLYLLDGNSLEQRKLFQPESKVSPRHLRAAEGGRWFAVSYHNGNLWLIDATSGEIHKPADVQGQGDISAIEFSGPNRLLVCDGSKRVYEYSLQGGTTLEREFAPKLSASESAYRYVVLPAYTLSPKPREFYQTTQYLLSGKESVGDGGQLDAKQRELHPWRPVWSSSIFIVVMLGFACLYIERQEF